MQHLLGVDSRCLTAAEDEHADLRPIVATIWPTDCDQNLVPIAQRLEYLQTRVIWGHCQLFGQPRLIAGQRHLRKRTAAPPHEAARSMKCTCRSILPTMSPGADRICAATIFIPSSLLRRRPKQEPPRTLIMQPPVECIHRGSRPDRVASARRLLMRSDDYSGRRIALDRNPLAVSPAMPDGAVPNACRTIKHPSAGNHT